MQNHDGLKHHALHTYNKTEYLVVEQLQNKTGVTIDPQLRRVEV